MTAPPPPPFHILRSHATSLSTLSFNPTNTTLYAGDQDGFISITDLRTRRTVCHWKAHDSGILGLQEWNVRLISQGRDNKIHIYEPQPLLRGSTLVGLAGSNRPQPVIMQTMDTNSLNFCRFSIASLPGSEDKGNGKGREAEALMAVPNLVDSELVDIYHLPSLKRIHASINLPDKPIKDVHGNERTGLVMSLHLGFIDKNRLRLVAAFEDGRVDVWGCEEDSSRSDGWQRPWEQTWDRRLSPEIKLWHSLWEAKGHNEAVMAMVVASDLSRAFTVSADHLIVRYDLSPLHSLSPETTVVISAESAKTQLKHFSTGHIGHASLAMSADDRVVAAGGWDGKIRLFSASTLKPLGTLSTHRETVHCVTFASAPHTAEEAVYGDESSTLEIGAESEEGEDSDEDVDEQMGTPPRSRWLASGGKDKRIALWGLKDFVVE